MHYNAAAAQNLNLTNIIETLHERDLVNKVCQLSNAENITIQTKFNWNFAPYATQTEIWKEHHDVADVQKAETTVAVLLVFNKTFGLFRKEAE